jgi:hypothetical protein
MIPLVVGTQRMVVVCETTSARSAIIAAKSL